MNKTFVINKIRSCRCDTEAADILNKFEEDVFDRATHMVLVSYRKKKKMHYDRVNSLWIGNGVGLGVLDLIRDKYTKDDRRK